MLLLPLCTVLARAAEGERDGVGEEVVCLIVESESQGYFLHLFAYRLVLLETDGLGVGRYLTLLVEDVHRNFAYTLFLLDVDM